eukprot:3202592-Rhodomonas_salina.2
MRRRSRGTSCRPTLARWTTSFTLTCQFPKIDGRLSGALDACPLLRSLCVAPRNGSVNQLRAMLH